jgi:hypothetical protein
VVVAAVAVVAAVVDSMAVAVVAEALAVVAVVEHVVVLHDLAELVVALLVRAQAAEGLQLAVVTVEQTEIVT